MCGKLSAFRRNCALNLPRAGQSVASEGIIVVAQLERHSLSTHREAEPGNMSRRTAVHQSLLRKCLGSSINMKLHV